MSKVSKWSSDLVVSNILETLRKWEIPIDERELVTGEGYVEIDGVQITRYDNNLFLGLGGSMEIATDAISFAEAFCNLRLEKEKHE
jgi:hypothetical protein